MWDKIPKTVQLRWRFSLISSGDAPNASINHSPHMKERQILVLQPSKARVKSSKIVQTSQHFSILEMPHTSEINPSYPLEVEAKPGELESAVMFSVGKSLN